MIRTGVKARRCKICKSPLTGNSSLKILCSVDCAVKYADTKKRKRDSDVRKEEKRWVREARKKLKTTSDYLKEAQVEFNRYIRTRDRGQGCISCGTQKPSIQYHAGHYKSRGAYPELRFVEYNCHLQCSSCNCMKSGNLIEYRKNLINKIGVKMVELLEGPTEPTKYTKEDAQRIKKFYRAKWRELEG